MRQLQKTNKIGIWGFGLVGKSVAHYFNTINDQINNNTYTLQVFDQRTLTKQEREYCDQYAISIASTIEDFLENNDTIIPSPGIDLNGYYEQYSHKWLPELDLFHSYWNKNWNKKSIAITGSVGKTSVTTLLSRILEQADKKIVTGGNIGIPCLNFIAEQIKQQQVIEQQQTGQKQKVIDYAILEISSYQLEYAQKYAPDVGIMTNCSPNHLDRHKTEENYLKAKLNLFVRQTDKQFAILPLFYRDYIRTFFCLRSICVWFSDSKPSDQVLALLSESEKLFYIHDGFIWLYDNIFHEASGHDKFHKKLLSLSECPSITFDQNWLIIIATCHILNQDMNTITSYMHNLSVPAHRLEKCGLVNGIAIYNDSKSTTMLSTIAAVNQLKDKPILLILGGLSKGVDRKSLIDFCKDRVKKIYCFGAESKELVGFCHDLSLCVSVPVSTDIQALEDIVSLALAEAELGDQLLFSPAGSSFDLFKDYQERGDAFKKIIGKLQVQDL